MNKKTNKALIWTISIIVFYAVLLVLLVVFERAGNPDETVITTFYNAIWYLLVTITTVGYGDMTPMTPWGRVIGVILMLSSAGLLTFFIGTLFSLFFGKLLPKSKLFGKRKKTWYIFHPFNDETAVLAENLTETDKDAAYIFLDPDGNSPGPEYNLSNPIVTGESFSDVLAIHKGNRPVNVFLSEDDGYKNFELGKEIAKENVNVYVKTDYVGKDATKDLVLFDRYDCIARDYWRRFPINLKGETVLIVGAGKLARKLFSRSILTNVLYDEDRIKYHLFGDWENFVNNHTKLSEILSVNEDTGSNDCVFFHDKMWNADETLIKSADRIIFCEDDEKDNFGRIHEYNEFFVSKADAYVYASFELNEGKSFGADRDIFTPEFVMKQNLNRVARELNDLYAERTGNGTTWDNLSEFKRQSNIASADHMLTKIRYLLSDEVIHKITYDNIRRAAAVYEELSEEKKIECEMLEHKRWSRFHLMNNWEYDKLRNDNERKHPLIVPFGELSREEQLKDRSAWEVLNDEDIQICYK